MADFKLGESGNPYDDPPDKDKDAPKRRTRTKKDETAAPKRVVPLSEIPSMAPKIEIGIAATGRVVQKWMGKPIPGYVIIRQSKDIGRATDEAVRKLAAKNALVRKGVEWFATIGEASDFIQPFVPVGAAFYLDYLLAHQQPDAPEHPFVSKCYEIISNAGIDLEKEGLVTLAAEGDTVAAPSLNGALERQETALERLIAEQDGG